MTDGVVKLISDYQLNEVAGTPQIVGKALEIMNTDPHSGDGYSSAQMAQLIGCNSDEIQQVWIMLRNKKYVKTTSDFSIDRVYPHIEGGDFIISGGFSAIEKMARLKEQNIEANIKSAETAEKVSKFQKRALVVMR